MDKTIYEIANDYIDKNTELKLKIIDLESEIKELKRILNLMRIHIADAQNISDRYFLHGMTDKEKEYIKNDELIIKETMLNIGDKNNG